MRIHLTDGRPSSTIARPMASAGRAALLLLVAVTLTAAGIPPVLDEDRSVPGYCSPDCPLQQVAHTVAVAPVPLRHRESVEPTRDTPMHESEAAGPERPALPDTPRAPPLA
jgi:hypothetical protein